MISRPIIYDWSFQWTCIIIKNRTECYFDVYFLRCFTTRERNTNVSLLRAHKQFATRVHTLFLCRSLSLIYIQKYLVSLKSAWSTMVRDLMGRTPCFGQQGLHMLIVEEFPESIVHRAMGPTWDRHDSGWPHVGPMDFAFWIGFTPPTYTFGSIHSCFHHLKAYCVGIQKVSVREVVRPNDNVDVFAVPFPFEKVVGDEAANKVFPHSSGPMEG